MSESNNDISQRFLFTDMDIRGEVVQLQNSYQEVLSSHHYPPVIEKLLGEFLAAACLMAATLKFDGKLTLQARGEGELGLIMAECTDKQVVRAVAQSYEQATQQDFQSLLGGGNLVITIDPEQGQRYQGIVPLEGETLAECLQAYFEQSEQLHTRFWLAVFNGKCSGLLLQQLPSSNRDQEEREANWQHVCHLANTLKPVELLDLEAQQVIYRLFHQDEHELFPAQPVVYRCGCSRERCLAALQTLPETERQSLAAEGQELVMDCQFCGKQYRFGPEDLDAAAGQEPPPVLH